MAPRAPRTGPPPAGATPAVIAVARHIEAHADEPLPLARLAAVAGWSPFHLQRTFKATLGVTPRQYQHALRIGRVKRSLRAGHGVVEAIFDAGFGSTSRLYERVDRDLAMSPTRYRKGGAGEVVRHVARRTRFGLLMMAATARGVCFVQFGDSDEALRSALARELPLATLRPSPATDTPSPALDAWMDALTAHLDDGAPAPDLPLDLRGTAFQLRVWRFLATTRPGDVLTYTELAERIGAPRSVRAAASACARNTVAVLIPCHRVLRGDGGLAGYRWGMGRKRALLDAEAAPARRT